MTNQTRRTFLGAAIAIPAAAATIATIAKAEADAGQDALILAAWERRQLAYDEIMRNGPYFEAELLSPEAAAIYDAADSLIINATVHTPAGALVQGWVA